MSKCGLTKIIIFLLAVLFGTGVSIWAKAIMSMPVDSDGSGGGGNNDESTTKTFQKPLFLTFSMFVAMSFGLLVHWLVVVFCIPFPGYDFNLSKEVNGVHSKEEFVQERLHLVDASLNGDVDSIRDDVNCNRYVPLWMYFYLAIPTIFDFAATILG